MIAHNSEEYRVAVARALTGVDDGLVFNGTPDHAKVVIQEAFKAAESHLRILSNRLSPACYGSPEVLDAASLFVRRPGTQLDILVEDPEAARASRQFLDSISASGVDQVSIKSVPTALLSEYTFNFLTVDGRAYRYEADRTKPIAVVAGGASAKDAANNLSSLFDKMFSHADAFEYQNALA